METTKFENSLSRPTIFRLLVCVLVANNFAAGLVSQADWFYNSVRPLVIGHRGSCGQFPEFSSGGYTDAYLNGADFIELIVQATADKVIVVNQDFCLGASTNVFAAFNSNNTLKQRTGSISLQTSKCTNDYLIYQFQSTELKNLKRTQREKSRNQATNGLFPVMSLEDTLKFLISMKLNQTRFNGTSSFMGINIEIVEPVWYNTTMAFDIASKVLQLLQKYNISSIHNSTKNGIPVILSSLDTTTLQRLSQMTDLPIVQTMWFNQTYNFTNIATYADGVKPDLDLVFYYPSLNRTGNYSITDQSNFVTAMHNLNLTVLPFTLSDDKLLFGANDTIQTKTVALKGVDGIFTDYVSGTLSSMGLIGSQSKLFQQNVTLFMIADGAVRTVLHAATLLTSLLIF